MRRRQYIAVLLAAFYVFSMSGIALGLHFCGGKLADVRMFGGQASCRMCSKMESLHQHNNCCKDASITVKVEDNHQAAGKILLQKLFEVTLPATTFKTELSIAAATGNTTAFLTRPPPLTGQPSLNILHCTFRI